MPRPIKDKLDLSNKNWLDILVDYRVVLTIVVAVVSVALAVFLSGLATDPTLKSGVDTSSASYLQHQKFIDIFGNDEFILVAAKTERGVGDPHFLKALDTITRNVTDLDNIAEVVSLTNLRIFQNKGKLFGNYPVVRTASEDLSLPETEQLENMKKALPIMDLLISPDLKTAGVLIRIQDECRFDPREIKRLDTAIEAILTKNLPQGTEHRVVGAALLRQAIVRYNIQTGIIFGLLCMLIGTVVSIYVFKSFRVTAITNVILGACVLWGTWPNGPLGHPAEFYYSPLFWIHSHHHVGNRNSYGGAVSSIPRDFQRENRGPQESCQVACSPMSDLFDHNSHRLRHPDGQFDSYGEATWLHNVCWDNDFVRLGHGSDSRALLLDEISGCA